MNRRKSDTDYAYAVARVRANELSLLSEADMEQLIDADSYEDAMRKLSDSGWGDLDESGDYATYLENYFAKTWDLLDEVLEGDTSSLNMLLIPNDMQNLKAALKGLILQGDTQGSYTKSTVYDTDELVAAVKDKRFSDLPDFMQEPAQKAYDVLVSTANGQQIDAIIDKATLEQMLKLAKETKSSTMTALAERKCACADIKIALRCANTKKTGEFLRNSLAECDSLSVDRLCEAAAEGQEAILDYLGETEYAEGADKYRESTSAFEKWCDDILMDCVYEARYTALGIDPIVAYYIARDAEIKSARIILSAKKNGLSNDIIRERVRTLYV